jgi:isoleucyl-tRNA synthetase
MRYLVSNLYDFDPTGDRVPFERMEEVDRFILARYAQFGERVLKAYDEYDYSVIFNNVNIFTNVDLSAFYNDISKDRLYTFASRAPERRSAQTAMYLMADGLTRLLAPILSVTAEQLWQSIPGRHEESVHIATFPTRAELAGFIDEQLIGEWDTLREIRGEVLAHIEPLRKDKKIGSSLQAKVILSMNESEMSLLSRHADALPMLFIVSEVELRPPAGPDTPRVTIERAGGVKCERCWRYVPRVSTDPSWAGLCERCQDALAETVNG